MKNVMKRAWEIYRTLEGNRLAKLSYALKQAWSEIKGGKKMKLTHGGWEVSKEQITAVTEWNKEVKGYVGMVDFKTEDGQFVSPYITKSELKELKGIGFSTNKIQALKYSGTY